MDKQYLISFMATIQGDRLVVQGLRNIEKSTKGVAQGTTQAGLGMQNFVRLALRSALVIPIWFAMRRIFMGIISTISGMIRAMLDLEEGLARIKTVVSSSSESVDADMTAIRRAILDVAVGSRVSIKELAEAFYFLRTANLSTEEAMAGFRPTISAMTGTMNSAKDTARALAGMYNTMGKYLGDNLTVHEKFQKIADVLTYTYATQDVQLDELISGYTKLAPYLAGLEDSFTELVTMLGVLNTRLLRSGRTGRLTGRAILQLTKNAKNLASIFGITFDPDKPINLLKTLGEIREQMGVTGKLTAKQGDALQKIFATRGGVAVRLLIEHFDELQSAIKLAEENADGFAEKMEEIRMGTVTAQAQRMKNILAVTWEEFYTGATGAGSLAEALRSIGDALTFIINPLKWIGRGFGFFFQQISRGLIIIEQFVKSSAKVAGRTLKPISPIKGIIETWNDALDEIEKAGLGKVLTWRDYISGLDEAIKKAEEEEKIRESIKTSEEVASEIRLNSLKEEKQLLTHTVNLMKIKGANQLDIAEYRLQELENIKHLMVEEEYNLELQKRQNDVIEARLKYRQQMIDVYQKAEIDMARAMGYSEFQILQVKKQQLEATRALIGDTQYLLQQEELRTQEAIALQREKQKELQIITDMYMRYEKAGMEEKARIRRMMELREVSAEELARRYKKDPYDRAIIQEYWNEFSKEGRQAVAEIIGKREDLPGFELFGEREDMEDRIRDLFKPSVATAFWDTWIFEAKKAVNIFKEEWKNAIAGGVPETVAPTRKGGGWVTRKEAGLPSLKVGVEPKIDVNIDKEALENIAEETAKQVEDKIKSNEQLAKAIAKIIRPYV